ncbi:hypothetical protein BC828DRAFT_3124 [Blastocladiella britannica]|nr:hypothetical protein BC828DRAFT_3124 [Blastocladiella britannica]
MTVLTQVAGGSSSSSSTSSSSFGASDYAQELIFDTLVYDAPRRTSPTTDARPDIVTAPSSRLAGSTDPSTLPAPAAKAAAERMYQRATTPRTLVANLTISGQPLVPPPPPTSASDDDGSYAILDTSSRPFDMGSSMSHVDGALYEGTRNALMRPRGVKGQPLGVAVVGGDTDPLGPVVRGILARMGYSVRDESELGQEWVAYANPAVARAAPRNSDWVQASSAPSSLAGGWARSVVIGVGIVLASGMWI